MPTGEGSLVAKGSAARYIRGPRPDASVSREVAMSRLNRLFKPKANGTYKVSDDLLKGWQDEKGKQEIIEEFSRCGFDKDRIL